MKYRSLSHLFRGRVSRLSAQREHREKKRVVFQAPELVQNAAAAGNRRFARPAGYRPLADACLIFSILSFPLIGPVRMLGAAADGRLELDFSAPPRAAQPWAWWFWNDGNTSADGIFRADGPRTVVPITLAPHSSVFVVFQAGAVPAMLQLRPQTGRPADREKYPNYRLPAGADLAHRLDEGKWTYKSGRPSSREFPWDQPPESIEGTFVFQRLTVRAELHPMGSLLLRKVLFEQDK